MNERDQKPSGGGGSGSGKAATQAAGQSVNGAKKVKSDPGRSWEENRKRKRKPNVQSESTCPPRLLRLLLAPCPRPIPEGCLTYRGRRTRRRDRPDSSKGAGRRRGGRAVEIASACTLLTAARASSWSVDRRVWLLRRPTLPLSPASFVVVCRLAGVRQLTRFFAAPEQRRLLARSSTPAGRLDALPVC